MNKEQAERALKITACLTPHALSLCGLLEDAGYEAYVVGGAVRDAILGCVPHDVDIATNATPNEVAAVLDGAGVAHVDAASDFGTVVALLEEEYEVTTFRKDLGYSDSRHPDGVLFSDSIEEDLGRRDFTVNAMAYRPATERFVDLFNGAKDLEEGVVRTVGEPAARFAEDPLRILRALRFSISKGMTIASETSEAMNAMAGALAFVSKERKTQELRKMLSSNALAAGQLLKHKDVLFAVVPELKAEDGCTQRSKYHWHGVLEHSLSVADALAGEKFVLRLAGLLHDVGKPSVKSVGKDGFEHFVGHPAESAKIAKQVVENSLCLTRKESDELLWLIENHDKSMFQTPKAFSKALRTSSVEYLKDLAVLQEADFADHVIPEGMSKAALDAWHVPFEAKMSRIGEAEHLLGVEKLAVGGRDLIGIGFKQGPAIGSALEELLSSVMSKEVPNERAALLERAREMKERLPKEQDEEAELL